MLISYPSLRHFQNGSVNAKAYIEIEMTEPVTPLRGGLVLDEVRRSRELTTC